MDSGSPFWRIQLDQDLLDTISAIYPEWFKVSRKIVLSCGPRSSVLELYNAPSSSVQDYTNTRASTSSSSSTSGELQLNTEGIVAADTSAVLEHKAVKGDTKSKSKAKKVDCLKEKERDRKEGRRESKDER